MHDGPTATWNGDCATERLKRAPINGVQQRLSTRCIELHGFWKARPRHSLVGPVAFPPSHKTDEQLPDLILGRGIVLSKTNILNILVDFQQLP